MMPPCQDCFYQQCFHNQHAIVLFSLICLIIPCHWHVSLCLCCISTGSVVDDSVYDCVSRCYRLYGHAYSLAESTLSDFMLVRVLMLVLDVKLLQYGVYMHFGI
eukprot:scpid58436/ scgid7521/ 